MLLPALPSDVLANPTEKIVYPVFLCIIQGSLDLYSNLNRNICHGQPFAQHTIYQSIFHMTLCNVFLDEEKYVW